MKNISHSDYFKLSAFKLFLLIIIISLNNSCLKAQKNYIIDCGPPGNFPIALSGNTNLNNGFGFEFNCTYHVLSNFSIYSGWDWNKFTCVKSFAGSYTDFEETGYVLGIKYIHPVENTNFNYFISAGTTLKHIEIQDQKGEIIADTDFGFGWETSIGIALNLKQRWSISPSFRMRSLKRSVNLNEIQNNFELSYISLKIAIGWKF